MTQAPRFIVEYDLPTDFRRARFYRAIKRYLEDRQLEGTGWSTSSVVITPDEDFAWYVHGQALKTGGAAHIYEAKQLDTPWPRKPLTPINGTRVTPIIELEEKGSEPSNT